MAVQPNLTPQELDDLTSKLRALGLNVGEANYLAPGGEDDAVTYPSIDDANAVTTPVHHKVVTVTGDTYTVLKDDFLVACDATNGSQLVTLPDVADGNQLVHIKKIDSSSNSVRVLTTDSQNIDGGTDYIIGVEYESVSVVSDGTQWWVI